MGNFNSPKKQHKINVFSKERSITIRRMREKPFYSGFFGSACSVGFRSQIVRLVKFAYFLVQIHCRLLQSIKTDWTISCILYSRNREFPFSFGFSFHFHCVLGLIRLQSIQRASPSESDRSVSSQHGVRKSLCLWPVFRLWSSKFGRFGYSYV